MNLELIVEFKNGWRNIAFALLIVSLLPLTIYFYLQFSEKLDTNHPNRYLVYSLIIYVLAILLAMIIAEYKIVRPRNEKIKAGSSDNQEAIYPSITIFRSISVKKKTLENTQKICVMIISIYVLAWIFLHYFDAYDIDILQGIESLPLIISAIVYTISGIHLKKLQPYRKLHWVWDIFILIIVGINFYDFVYSPLPAIPPGYIWVGPVTVIIVFIVALWDVKRSSKKPTETA